MALDPQYIVSIAFEQTFVDNNTGLPLAGGYMEFYDDSDRITPKTVYQLTGSPPNYTYTALPNPLSLSSVGTPIDASSNPVNVYAFPYDADNNVELYYVRVYDAAGNFQFDWEAWPNVTDSDNPNTLLSGYQNQLANAQFVDVNFVPAKGVTISFSTALSNEEYDIAPGWTAVISSSGAGSVTFARVAITGAAQIQTNPSYFLSVTPGSNVTNLVLRQTLTNNPDIWSTTLAENGYVSACMLITSYDSQSHDIEMQYRESAGVAPAQTLVSGSTGSEGFQFFNATVLLDPGANPDNGDSGAIYIDMLLPTIGNYGITSLQVVGLGEDDITVDYQQEPANRQRSQLFYYYQDQLNYKPIPSFLTGWEFPLNPAQFNGTSVTPGAVDSAYLWDQTIGFQSVQSTMSVTRVTSGNATGALQLTATGDSQFAIIQYLALPQITPVLTTPLSAHIRLSTSQSDLIGTIGIFYTEDTNVPDLDGADNSIVATLSASGAVATTNGTWTEIPRKGLGAAEFTVGTTGLGTLQSYGFNGWEIDLSTVDTSAITFVAIVVGFSEISTANAVAINSCSLVPGYIPTLPGVQTQTQVLKECEYYYEKSYGLGVDIGSATSANVYQAWQRMWFDVNAGPQVINAYASAFQLSYRTEKIFIPAVEFYTYLAPFGSDTVVTVLRYATVLVSALNLTVSTTFDVDNISTTEARYTSIPTSAVSSIASSSPEAQAFLLFHYTLDSRIGIYKNP